MSKYTIDITFLELDGIAKKSELVGLSYEKVLEVYAFSKIMNMTVQKISVHTNDVDNRMICIEEFLVQKITEKSCYSSSSMS